jgi:hypothetical protein
MNAAHQMVTDILCAEHKRLRDNFARTIHSLVKAQAAYTIALRLGNSRVWVFQEDLQAAAAEWKMARHCYAQHVVTHGC